LIESDKFLLGKGGCDLGNEFSSNSSLAQSTKTPLLECGASRKPVLIAGPGKQPGNAMAVDVDYVDVVRNFDLEKRYCDGDESSFYFILCPNKYLCVVVALIHQ
jgi:hypothetical protein